MTMPIFLHNKSIIETYYRNDPALYAYELGDLDDFFWPYTTWFASLKAGNIPMGSPAKLQQVDSLFLLYAGLELPVVLAQARDTEGLVKLKHLLTDSLTFLPRRFYSHLSPGLVQVLQDQYPLVPHGLYWKMKLAEPENLAQVDTAATQALTSKDCDEVRAFYNAAYPDNWFDPRMLETGCYFGIRRQGRLVSVAGIHVYSPQYRTATLGNITTLDEFRGQGYATAVTARVCRELLKTVDTIGLNVRGDNSAAIRCYQKLGFVKAAEYEEWMVG